MSEKTTAKAIQQATGWGYQKALYFLREKRNAGAVEARCRADGVRFKEAAVRLAREAQSGRKAAT